MAVSSANSVDLGAAMVTAPTALADWVVILPVALPILGGAILLMVRHQVRLHAWMAVVVAAATLAATTALLGRVIAEGALVMTMGRWLPPFGISFNADALGATFALTATFVTLLGALFAIRDIDGTGRRYGFYPFLLLMLAGVNGSFLTGDLFNLYVWFEVFVISSFGLLVLGSEQRQIDGATKYAVLNLVATTVFLIATGALYGTLGTLNMADIANKVGAARETGPLMTIATLLLLAFGMKAAAFPLNFWLPASYHTPRIVTSALFGGLLTKVGIYALLRSMMVLFPLERIVLSELIAWVAGATMVLGIMGALAQSDLRRIVGFVVVSGIGVMLAGLALGSPLGLAGTVLYAVHSILIMTALYLLVGLMHEAGGSYSLHDVAGLYRAHPMLAAIAFALVLAAAGLPPLSGLWPKVVLVKASLDAGMWWLAIAILVSGILTTVALARVFALAFWRDRPEGSPAGDDGAATQLGGGYAILAGLLVPAVWIGVYPEPVLQLAQLAAAGLTDPSAYLEAVFPLGPGS
ncbi:Na+/H+ antiporter subunit D [Nitratireductor sp. CAU 1489]|uniref:Na+/H+ antiporter subunit D n=1 Tax=Nitratireductor arenosus TaxID=2682096 RepID=A0A844QJT7_9HYPH|nr:Na+/H+ antiporter subunit D [Nitratireductor arenosus]MVA99852.1 Na+/H+ antiporter subunit D [Nitratireductor arenosus]